MRGCKAWTCVTDDLRNRADDLIWRVQVGGDWEYLLIGFQSTVDKYMPSE